MYRRPAGHALVTGSTRRHDRREPTARALLLALFLLAAQPWTSLGPFELPGSATAEAQSIVRGEVAGTVRTLGGAGIPEVEVTLIRSGSGTELYANATRDGDFLVSMLEADEYDILVEARGFIPRRVRGVRVRPGQVAGVNVNLVPTELPPQRVDTVDASGIGHSRYDGESGRWIRGAELAAHPDPRGGWIRAAALAPHLDGSLGSEGLPPRLTSLVVDGVALTPAAHPTRPAPTSLPLLPRSALTHVSVHRRADVEWSGAAGSYVAAATRPAGGAPSIEVFASGSGGPLWESSGPEVSEAAAGSFWGGAAAHLPFAGSGTRLFLGAEGMSTTTPRPAALPGELAARVPGAALSSSGATVEELSTPWSTETRAATGLARLDWELADQASVMVRAAFATQSEDEGSFSSLPEVHGAELPVEARDISLAASVLARAHPRVTVEFRGALERSTREWGGPSGGASGPPLPATRLVTDGLLLGAPPGVEGRVERTGFLGNATGHFLQGPHWIKGGISFSVASHTFEHLHGSTGEYFVSAPETLSSDVGEGFFRQIRSSAGTPSFSVPELGVFAQYRWEPLRGVRLTSAIRYDREILPVDRLVPNPEWRLLTGLPAEFPTESLAKISPRLSVSWDLSGDGATVIEGSMAAQFDRFDPAALAEVAALSGSVTTRTLAGEGVAASWPELPSGGGAENGFHPILAFFGPDVSAPRTARASAGVSQGIGEVAFLHLTGTFRRTEFLLRRSDLNLAPVPTGTLADGRPVIGTLAQWGSVVGPLPGTERRFGDFGPVWALTSDGVSEHMGVTLALELSPAPRLDVFAAYTYSVTEDNLVGAAAGIPEAALVPQLSSSAPAGAWEEGPSDFDVPHRWTSGARWQLDLLQGAELSGVYRFESGRPFTAGYRSGVDVNGDGSFHNDPAFVPASLSGLSSEATACLTQDSGRFARRNGCRGDGVHLVDLRFTVAVTRWGGSLGSLTVELFNLLDGEFGRPDTALLLVDPAGTLTSDPGSGVTTLPLTPNPEFGEVTRTLRPGRVIRLGFRVGTP